MTIDQLIHDVLAAAGDATTDRSNTLLSILREKHYWPALQMKKFHDHSGLVLLHNTYKRTDVSSFQELYDECRSVVLDLNAPEGQNIVVSLAHGIPERVSVAAYKEMHSETDVCELGYEGTVIYVYNHNGVWHFSTSGCPSMDRSKYFHPTKTHGEMFDEAIGGDRDAFVQSLCEDKTYSFVLVHHQNRHIMSYNAEFGGVSSYAELIHIGTRDRASMSEDDIQDRPLASLGVKYARRFTSPEEAIETIENSNHYCVIVKTVDNKILKVAMPHILATEECHIGNPNNWHNMLHVYMQNNPNFHITDYINLYAPDLVIPTNSSGRQMAPTYIIHTVMCTMRDILYDLYVQTTSYNKTAVWFKMNKELDASLAPVLRFHLAQLRHIQITTHTHGYVTPRAVYQYLCFNQTLKNMKTLINFFASNGGHQMNFRQAECFGVLNQLLSE
jgi:hypothetical protein